MYQRGPFKYNEAFTDYYSKIATAFAHHPLRLGNTAIHRDNKYRIQLASQHHTKARLGSEARYMELVNSRGKR